MVMEKLIEALDCVVSVDGSEITSDTLLRKDLELNSIDTATYLAELEDIFHMEIEPEGDLEDISLGQLAEYITGKKAAV